jgi:hypothetical protein
MPGFHSLYHPLRLASPARLNSTSVAVDVPGSMCPFEALRLLRAPEVDG